MTLLSRHLLFCLQKPSAASRPRDPPSSYIACRPRFVPFTHNWRWQRPLRTRGCKTDCSKSSVLNQLHAKYRATGLLSFPSFSPFSISFSPISPNPAADPPNNDSPAAKFPVIDDGARAAPLSTNIFRLFLDTTYTGLDQQVYELGILIRLKVFSETSRSILLLRILAQQPHGWCSLRPRPGYSTVPPQKPSPNFPSDTAISTLRQR